MPSLNGNRRLFADIGIAPELRFVIEKLGASGDARPPSGLDASLVAALARHHRVAARLMPGLEADAPALAGALRPMARYERRLATMLALETARVARSLAEAGVPVLALKGACLSVQLFGPVFARSSRDMDLLVPPSHLAAMISVLESLGYRTDPARIAANAIGLCNTASGLVIEVHTSLAEVDSLLPMARFRPFDDPATVTISGIPVPTLSLEKAVVYAAYHGTRHLWSELAWVADMAAAAQIGLDWTRAFALAETLGIAPQLALGCRLATEMLGARFPSSAPVPPPSAATVAAMDHLRRCPPLPQREAVESLGRLRFLRWEMSMYTGLAGKLGIVRKHCMVSPTDRKLVTLPPGLSFLYGPLRLARLAWRLLPWRR